MLGEHGEVSKEEFERTRRSNESLNKTLAEIKKSIEKLAERVSKLEQANK